MSAFLSCETMDPIELFKLVRGDGYEFRQVDGEWYYQQKSNSGTVLPIQPLTRDRQFLQIKGCVESRKKSNGLFTCRCGVCQGYLAQRLYEMVIEKREPTPIETTQSTPNICNKTLLFGKYLGQEYDHVYITDKKYCIWCIEKAAQDKLSGRVSDSFHEFVNYVKAKIVGPM